MKKNSILLAAFLALTVGAQTNLELARLTGTSTNIYSVSERFTIYGICTNALGVRSNWASIMTGDPLPVSFIHLNHSLLFLANQQTNLRSAMLTNLVFTATNLPAGSAPTAVVTGVTNGIAYVLQGIPAGAPGTNTVTAYNLSNSVYTSSRLTTLTTNNAPWGRSNYLGRVNGLYDWTLNPGTDGGNPPMVIPMSLIGSFTGTNAWFVITNGFTTTNYISVSYITNGLSLAGLARATLGNVKLYSIDHWELLGRTNNYFGQHQRFDVPVDGSDATTKSYVDTAIANALDGRLVGSFSNFVYHLSYAKGNGTILDIASTTVVLPIAMVVDGTGTNLAITTPVTNLVSGWSVVSSTNLLLVNGFTTYTNFSTNITSGILTITTPIIFGETMRFYQVVGPGKDTANWGLPVGMPYVQFTGTNASYPSLTVTHSTNSTFGYGAGLLTADTNYFYVSIGTNAWRRVAIPTNTW